MKKSFCLVLIILFCLSFMVACSSDPNNGETTARGIYIISNGNLRTYVDGQGTVSTMQESGHNLAVNGEGNIILPATKDSIDVLSDKLTKEPKYLVRYHTEASEQKDEDGYPEKVIYTAALYDLNGQLVRDFAVCSYGDLVGDTLAYYSGEYVNLLDIKTGKMIYENLSSLEMMDTRIFASTQDQQYILGDYSGNIVKRIDRRQFDYSLNYQDYVAVAIDDLFGVMDADGNMKVEAKYTDIRQLWVNYILCSQDKSYDVIDLETGEVVFQSQDQINYYDGTTAIIRKADTSDSDLEQDEKYLELLANDPDSAKDYEEKYNGRSGQNIFYLTDAQGNICSEGYETLYACYSENETYNQQYYFAQNPHRQGEKDQEVIFILDSKGQILFSYTGESAFVNATDKETFIISDYASEILDDGTYVNHSKAMIVDKEGKYLVEEGKYQYIYAIYNTRGNNNHYYTGSYVTKQGVTLYDLLDGEGNVLVSQLKACTQCDGERIVGVKGFSSGLMDLKGNWVYESPIFINLED